jgi:hypothetical protein
MNNTTYWLAAGTVLAMLGLASGCSTTHGTAEETGKPAVMCGKCETVWVRSPRTINKTTVYRKHQKMVCHDCDSAVENFFKTGKFSHACKTCGDSLVACSVCD